MAMVMENQQPLAPMPVVPAPPLPPPPPPPLPPPPQAYKHRCKVCKKGFMCGRALGGHMRAHGVTDDGLSADDDDDDSVPCAGAWDSSEAAAAATTTKRMYSLRTNAGRHKNCRVCENCGKEFTSWKSLLDHGRCNYDREKDDLNIAGADIDAEDEEDLALAAGGWSKGKRTRRTKVIVVDNGSQIDEPQLVPTTSREEEDLANCLVMLASSSGGVQPQAIADVHQQPYASTSKGERAPARKDEQRFLVPPQPISMLPPTVPQFKFLAPPQVMPSPAVPRGLFECKACKKVFTSHQALGGHRASHKKVKGCFAAKLEESSRNDSPQPSAASSNDNVKVVVEAIPAIVDTTESNGVDGNAEVNMLNARTTAVVAATSAPEMANIMQVDEAPSSSTVSPFKKKGKVHECSICNRVFMSGQALGGHKRCHWLTTGAGDPTAAAVAKLPFITQDHVMHAAMCQQLTLGPPVYGTSDSCLDLNVPMNQSADPAATRQAAGINESMLNLNAPASLYMHSWAGHTNASNMHNTAATSGHYDLPEASAATEDEADSTSAKRAKISDLKDMNMAGETSPWLQVGIALPSETNERLLKPKG
ncbi:unnamed protein product [Miscanthus lutarioriparius]|uniref:C2H2-type domain-containing protein n=1 Tax=Miscanthus lutarioriparius TaxID=422564 RepID=A0A811P9B5_9POAL|nr:unnamed protein product [Miscanthus lutarioriparius]